jgi:uncharacterized protein (DUF58 family)
MRRGGALVLGGVVLGAAVVFASRPLGVAGLGLLLAALVARVWVSLAGGPVDVRTTVSPDPATEGDEVTVRIDAARGSRLPVGSAVVVGTLDGIGSYECRLRSQAGRLTGELELGRLPRGLFEGADAMIELRDPLGLEARSRPLGVPVTALVQPRLVDLRGLFDDRGRLPGESRRFLMRRPSGFDLHSVREYEQGESLRRVHWPTTARRGQLMVKELEDSPRESLVVVLDCDPAGDAGTSPDSSFDDAVRAAGSVLRVHVLRGRRCALVTTTQPDCTTRASSLEGEFASVLGTLASVQADAPHDLARFLEQPPRAVGQALEIVVVTASETPAAARRLLELAGRRAVAVVWVDAASYVGRPTRAVPALLQLSAAGIPIAVVRHGEDLATALEASRAEARASG